MDGPTPLHWAAHFGLRDVVKLLMDKGAEPDKKDLQGRTPLQWAKRSPEKLDKDLGRNSIHHENPREKTVKMLKYTKKPINLKKSAVYTCLLTLLFNIMIFVMFLRVLNPAPGPTTP